MKNKDIPSLSFNNEVNSLIDLLEFNARNYPDDLAYRFLEKSGAVEDNITYLELSEKVKVIAIALQKSACLGDRVLILSPPGIDYIASFFACLYAGVVPVPAYPPTPGSSVDRIRVIVEDAAAEVVLTNAAVKPFIEAFLKMSESLKDLRVMASDTLVEEGKWEPPVIGRETLAFLQYTSGSTGNPKGVMVTHGNLLHNLEQIRQSFNIKKESRIMAWLPPYHDMGLIGGILEPMYCGASSTLMSPLMFLKKPMLWLEMICKYRITISGGPDFAYELCAKKATDKQLSELDLSSLELLFNGAEPIRAATYHKFCQTFTENGFSPNAYYPCYGMAEATLFVTGGKSDAPVVEMTVDKTALTNGVIKTTSDDTPSEIKQLIGCGQGWLDQELKIVNPETLEECQPGEIGEIWTASKSIAQGYWGDPEKTAQAFAGKCTSSDRAYLRTGDLGTIYNDELFVTGRLKDVVIIAGKNHYPTDMEYTVTESHPLVKAGCSICFSVDAEEGEGLVVVSTLNQKLIDKNIDPKTLSEDVCNSIAAGIIRNHGIKPLDVVLLTDKNVPKTSSGKLQRSACKHAYIKGEFAA